MSAVLSDDMELTADTLSGKPSTIWIVAVTSSEFCRSTGVLFGFMFFAGGMSVLLFSLGVEVDAGIIVINCSVSMSVFFVGELLILFIFLSKFLLMRAGLLGCFVAGVLTNFAWSFDVKTVIGLPCEESDARFLTSTDLLL